MYTLADQIADAKAEVERLERLAASATCAELGHDMHSLGGCNAGCREECSCSVPVNVCRRCGDCDYGDNAEAERVRADCALKWGEPNERFADGLMPDGSWAPGG